MKYIVVGMMNGKEFEYYGPFNSRSEAREYAERIDPTKPLGFTWVIRILME